MQYFKVFVQKLLQVFAGARTKWLRAKPQLSKVAPKHE